MTRRMAPAFWNLHRQDQVSAGMRTLAMVAIAAIIAAPEIGAQVENKTVAKFEIASVKQNNSGGRPTSNFPLGPGDVYVANAGAFSATNQTLINYISFAYKIRGNQLEYLASQLPVWVTTDRFDIRARAEGTPGKDQMRLMMRSLLADRFMLAIHNEIHQLPVLGLVLSKPGKTGPRIRPHPDDGSCATTALSPSETARGGYVQTTADGFPVFCTAVLRMPTRVSSRVHLAGRNVTVAYIAEALSAAANLGRPMVDQTGMKGTVDFDLEFEPDRLGPLQGSVDSRPDIPSGPTLQTALREQLGFKLKSQKAPIEVLVVDHVEHPSEN